MSNDKISATLKEVNGDFSEVKKVFKRGNVYIVLFPDDTILFAKNMGGINPIQVTFYLPHIGKAQIVKMTMEKFKKGAVSGVHRHLYEHYEFISKEFDLDTDFVAVGNAMLASRKGHFKNYLMKERSLSFKDNGNIQVAEKIRTSDK